MKSKWWNPDLYGKNWKQVSKEVRSNKTCVDCHRTLTLRDLQADHVVPLSQGGKTSKANLRTRCIWCHKRKTALCKPKNFPRGKIK